MLVDNLLQNTLKYARQSVAVVVRQVDNGTLLTVSDDDPGIPVSQHRTALMPFTRGDNNSTEKGHGLGLAIVNRITKLHGGSVDFDFCPELLDARVSILFPAAR